MLLLSACDPPRDQDVVREDLPPPLPTSFGQRGSTTSHGSATASRSGQNAHQQGHYSYNAPAPSRGSLRERVALAATESINHRICSRPPNPRVKCAEQASRVLRSAGVSIQGSWSVNELVTQLRRAGWRDGPCQPGAVKHSAGPSASGRHIGVVGTRGEVVHNSGTRDPNCGVMGTHRYPAWDQAGRASCLVPPGG